MPCGHSLTQGSSLKRRKHFIPQDHCSAAEEGPGCGARSALNFEGIYSMGRNGFDPRALIMQ